MDSTTTALIISQAITFLLLVISEILPFTDSPYNGTLQIVIDALKKCVTPPQAPPSIVVVEKKQEQEPVS